MEKKGFRLFGMDWKYFAIFAAIVLITLYVPIAITGEDVGVKTNLPGAMLGCFSLMILLGAIFNEIGNRAPIVKSYLGGGAIVCIFAASAMVYFKLFPTSLVMATPQEGAATKISGNMYTFFASSGGFLDWYIAALICGSILGMNKKLLVKASARYLPAILGGVAVAFGAIMPFLPERILFLKQKPTPLRAQLDTLEASGMEAKSAAEPTAALPATFT